MYNSISKWLLDKDNVTVIFDKNIRNTFFGKERLTITMDVRHSTPASNGIHRKYIVNKVIDTTPTNEELIDILESMYKEGINMYHQL